MATSLYVIVGAAIVTAIVAYSYWSIISKREMRKLRNGVK
jgi:hypothetical protein